MDNSAYLVFHPFQGSGPGLLAGTGPLPLFDPGRNSKKEKNRLAFSREGGIIISGPTGSKGRFMAKFAVYMEISVLKGGEAA
jgi:hypothetical protein